MKRKNYDLIAKVIKKYALRFPHFAPKVLDIFIEELKKENANFNPDKFKKACL